MTPHFRKTALITILMLLMAAAVLAAPGIPVTTTQSNNRNWRLEQKLTQAYLSGNWLDNQLLQNYFNPSNQTLVDSTRYSYRNGINTWIVGSVDHFSYNISQEYITQIVTNLVMPSQSIPMQRSVYIYDIENRLISARLMVSGLDRDWIETKRVWFSYNGNALQQIMTYDNSLIYRDVMYYKTEFQFDPQGRIAQMFEYASSDSLNWMNMYQTTFLYHPNDNTNAATLVELISKGFYRYLHYSLPLEIGMVAEQQRQSWMYTFWRDESRDTFTYDNNNRLIYHQNYLTDMAGVWQNNFQKLFGYDLNSNLATELQQNWNPDIWDWENYQQQIYTWGNPTSSDDETTPELNPLQLSAYPNPCRDNIAISLKSQSRSPVKMILYNSKGQKLCEEIISAESAKSYRPVRINNLIKASGIYLLQAQQDNMRKAVKLVKLGNVTGN